MNSYKSYKINIINVWNKQDIPKIFSDIGNNICNNICNSINKNYFIYEMQQLSNGQKKIYRLEIERYVCNKCILKETYKTITLS